MLPPFGAERWGDEWELLVEWTGELEMLGEERSGPGQADGENREYA